MQGIFSVASAQFSGDQVRVNAQLIDAEAGASPLGRTIRHAPRRSVADPGRNRQPAWRARWTFSLTEVEATRLKRDAGSQSDRRGFPALRGCVAGVVQGRYFVQGSGRGSILALRTGAPAIDPNNVRALQMLGVKFWMPAALGLSADAKGDLERADELSRTAALALDPDWTWPHDLKGGILRIQGRTEDAVAEHERALALDFSNVRTLPPNFGHRHHRFLGRSDKSLEYLGRAILASPYDPAHLYLLGTTARRGPILG